MRARTGEEPEMSEIRMNKKPWISETRTNEQPGLSESRTSGQQQMKEMQFSAEVLPLISLLKSPPKSWTGACSCPQLECELTQ